ncbi:hypothetical protein ACW6AV_002337 [Edwardsiella piscicida]|uniref:hypothetical protein n=1 Tax=Edwardsiella piscicida TaxID=1263550 RepID=UPI00101ACB9C|nr:hypothetical protein [Edwardsiella piscicida]ELM3734817.1 hypothetical protein [Edwardsiella piscicida]QBB14221.1 hypothetical protein EVK84_17565 [Edwardsiella piscicida]WGS78535.1 hypothetical protein PED68_07800 [Edwardsiella piscicida]WGS81920.1 hypothetical protein PED70_07805 [Edwardsiella piscicida]
MFKFINGISLKSVLLRAIVSGWAIAVLVLVVLYICSAYGQPAFLVWWFALTGVVLLGFSLFLYELHLRLIKPVMHICRFARLWSWIIWVVALVFFGLPSLVAPTPTILILLEPLGVLTGILVCLWVKRKGLLAWIQ